MAGIGLTDFVKPKNDAFTGIVQASQVLGGGGDGTLPDATVAESNVTQHEGAINHDALLNFDADEHFTEASIDHTAIQNIGTNSHATIDTRLAHFGSLVDSSATSHPDVTVTESGGTVSLNIEQDGGGDIDYYFGGVTYTLDCTPLLSLALTAGTDAAPQINYVYITESGSVLTLTKSTSGFPATPYAPVCITLIQSAASVAIDGAMKVHVYTDHLKTPGDNGHIEHINNRLRGFHASWISGVAGADMVVSSPDAYLSTAVGEAFQLHEHVMPARDMQTGDPAYLVNDPTTPFARITTLDSITQDATGNTSINNKYMNLVLWAVVSEDEADCKIFINLPSGLYTTSASSDNDIDDFAVFAIPAEYKGVGFLVARYSVQVKTSGAWVQSSKVDLRGLSPSTSPGGGHGLAHVVEDLAPQLGGDLDVNGFDIVSVSNGDINITPDGTGTVIVNGRDVVKDSHRTFSITVQNPANGDRLVAYASDDAVTLTEVRAYCVGATSVAYTLLEKLRDNFGGATVSTMVTGSATTTPANETLSDASLAADSIIELLIGTVSGSPTNLIIIGKYAVT